MSRKRQRKRQRKRSRVARQSVIQRAKEVLADCIMLDLKEGRYKVESQSQKDKFYDVTTLEGKWGCTCKYHISGRKRHCKHIVAVQMVIMRSEAEKQDKQAKKMVISKPKEFCPHCKKKAKCWSRGNRKNQHIEPPRRTCTECKRTFTDNPGAVGRHYSLKTIAWALIHRCTNASQADAAMMARGKDGRQPHESTIGRWEKDYGVMLKKISDRFAHGRVGDQVASDELHLKVAGIKEAHMFGIIDVQSRFLIDYDTTDTKQGYDSTDLCNSVIRITGKKPRIVIIDALAKFAKGVEKTLLKNNKHVIYIKDAGIRKVHVNNNKRERLNGTLKPRFMLARGFWRLRPALLDLYLPYYNLFKPHSALGGISPAKKLGLVIKTDTGRLVEEFMVAIQYAALFCT